MTVHRNQLTPGVPTVPSWERVREERPVRPPTEPNAAGRTQAKAEDRFVPEGGQVRTGLALGLGERGGVDPREPPEGSMLRLRKWMEDHALQLLQRAKGAADGLFERLEEGGRRPDEEVKRTVENGEERITILRRDAERNVLSLEVALRGAGGLRYERTDWTGRLAVRRRVVARAKSGERTATTEVWPAALSPNPEQPAPESLVERHARQERVEISEQRVTQEGTRVEVVERQLDHRGEHSRSERHRVEPSAARLASGVRTHLEVKKPVHVRETVEVERPLTGPPVSTRTARYAQGEQQVTQRDAGKAAQVLVERHQGATYVRETYAPGRAQPLEVLQRVSEQDRIVETIERPQVRGAPPSPLPWRERVETELDRHGQVARRRSELVASDGARTQEAFVRTERRAGGGAREVRERSEVVLELPAVSPKGAAQRYVRTVELRAREQDGAREVLSAEDRVLGPDGRLIVPGMEPEGGPWERLFAGASATTPTGTHPGVPVPEVPTQEVAPVAAASASGAVTLPELAPVARPPAGWSIGRFQVVRKLGSGGMGEVYLVRTPAEGGEGWKELVLKRVLPHLAEDETFLQRFLDEGRICARLNHPNIAKVEELGLTEGSWYLAMEYVQGTDVKTLFSEARERNQPVPVEVACRLAADIAGALHHAHGATDGLGNPLGVIHRDVSPHNILVGLDGKAKLIDFGVAKARFGDRPETQAGLLHGKLTYMAPEQLAGARLDPRADVFSLGVVLWELLAGKRLFDAPTEPLLMMQVTECVVAKPSTARPDLPAALDAVALKALARTASKRFPHAAGFKQAIEEACARHGVAATTDAVRAFVQAQFAWTKEQDPTRTMIRAARPAR